MLSPIAEVKLDKLKGLLLLFTFVQLDNARTVEGNSSVRQKQSSPCINLSCNLTNILETLKSKSSLDLNETLPCRTESCFEAAVTILSNMDPNQDPCIDFYQFACGGYETLKKKTDDKLILDSRMKRTLRNLLTCYKQKGEPDTFQKLRDYYSSCFNAESYPKKQIEGLQQILGECGGWPLLNSSRDMTDFSWQDATANLLSKGFSNMNFLGVGVYGKFDVSLAEPSRILWIRSPGKLSYRNEAHRELMKEVAIYLGAPEDHLNEEIEKMMKFEDEFNKIIVEEESKLEQLFDLNIVVTVGDLNRISKEVDWLKYFSQIFPINIDTKTPVFLQIEETKLWKIITLLKKTSNKVIANCIAWEVIFETKDNIKDPKIMKLVHAYNKKIRPVIPSKQPLQWLNCLNEMKFFLTPGLNALFARYHFPQGHKDQIIKILEMVRHATENLIEKADWLDESSIQQLKLELSKFNEAIAYPDDLLDDKKLDNYYKSLKVTKREYYLNYIQLKQFLHLVKSEETIVNGSKNQWTLIDSLFPTTTYYYNSYKAMVLPMSQLQGFYFAANRSQALNFGSIGSILGHEIYHGLKEFGLTKFDDDVIYWTPKVREIFLNRTTCIKEQYKNFPLRNTSVGGLPTFEENLSDNSGLKAAYMAYQSWIETNGEDLPLLGLTEFTGNQLFWLAFASNWCTPSNLITESEKHQEFLNLLTSNKYRVIGTVQNLEEFANDFNCPSGSPMNPIEKCKVW
uniref:Neprilysin n=1 Tax=Hemiscolopendra marginata TaxID=943146 RepID=A0A646QCN2_9MYRI